MRLPCSRHADAKATPHSRLWLTKRRVCGDAVHREAHATQDRGSSVVKQPTIAICAGLLMLGVAAPLPAAAQAVYPGYRAYPVQPDYALMPPYEVMAAVRATGMRPLGRPLRHGPIYVVVA